MMETVEIVSTNILDVCDEVDNYNYVDASQVDLEFNKENESPKPSIENNGYTPLHHAVSATNTDSALQRVRVLLAMGADPNRQDWQGCTPVHLAASFNRAPLLELLLGAGGCPLLADLSGRSAVDIAAECGAEEAAEVLTELLDSDVVEEEEKETVMLTFWRRGAVLVSNATPSEDSFHSCTSYTTNWVLTAGRHPDADVSVRIKGVDEDLPLLEGWQQRCCGHGSGAERNTTGCSGDFIKQHYNGLQCHPTPCDGEGGNRDTIGRSECKTAACDEFLTHAAMSSVAPFHSKYPSSAVNLDSSTPVQRELNTAFLHSSSFISFMNRTRGQGNKSASLFTSCLSATDEEEQDRYRESVRTLSKHDSSEGHHHEDVVPYGSTVVCTAPALCVGDGKETNAVSVEWQDVDVACDVQAGMIEVTAVTRQLQPSGEADLQGCEQILPVRMLEESLEPPILSAENQNDLCGTPVAYKQNKNNLKLFKKKPLDIICKKLSSPKTATKNKQLVHPTKKLVLSPHNKDALKTSKVASFANANKKPQIVPSQSECSKAILKFAPLHSTSGSGCPDTSAVPRDVTAALVSRVASTPGVPAASAVTCRYLQSASKTKNSTPSKVASAVVMTPPTVTANAHHALTSSCNSAPLPSTTRTGRKLHRVLGQVSVALGSNRRCKQSEKRGLAPSAPATATAFSGSPTPPATEQGHVRCLSDDGVCSKPTDDLVADGNFGKTVFSVIKKLNGYSSKDNTSDVTEDNSSDRGLADVVTATPPYPTDGCRDELNNNCYDTSCKDLSLSPTTPVLSRLLNGTAQPAASSPLSSPPPTHHPPPPPSVLSGCSVAVVEEYLYTDEAAGVSLIERRGPVIDSVAGTLRSTLSRQSGPRGQQHADGAHSDEGSSLSPSVAALSFTALRQELLTAGARPGPVTDTTWRCYARQLERIRRGADAGEEEREEGSHYPRELQQALNNPNRTPWERYRCLEASVMSVFLQPRPLDYWRGGCARTCFNYLLLDPVLTEDLPLRVNSLSAEELFAVFVSAIFYIGKGSGTRPYEHLYQALHQRDKVASFSGQQVPDKVSRILSIWSGGRGVVSLHVFQNMIPAEAHTREAAMIDAIGLGNLCNVVSGSYYGPAQGLSPSCRRMVGLSLLQRAMLLLLCEGERQLRPADLPPQPVWKRARALTKRT